MTVPSVALRPVVEADLEMLRRFAVDREALGPDWPGFTDVGELRRRFDADGYLGDDRGLLVIAADDEAAGEVSWQSVRHGGGGNCWNIGVAVLPEWRGRGVGWRAQRQLCDYLFAVTPVQRIEAAARADNTAERRALERAGFACEGVLRSARFNDGAWRDVAVYSRLRDDAE